MSEKSNERKLLVDVQDPSFFKPNEKMLIERVVDRQASRIKELEEENKALKAYPQFILDCINQGIPPLDFDSYKDLDTTPPRYISECDPIEDYPDGDDNFENAES